MSRSREGTHAGALMLAVLCCGCVCANDVRRTGTASAPPTHDSEKEMQVKEQLFRYAIRSRVWVKVWFIDYGDGRDPPAGFLDRLKDLPVTLRSISSLTGDRLEVRDPESGEEAWIASAKIVRWVDGFTAEIEFASYHGPASAGGWAGLIELIDGEWVFSPSRGWNF